jgi:hypothetical protein
MLLVYSIIVAVGIIGIGLMLMAFTYPEYYYRFGKFLFRTIKHALGKPTFTPGQEEAKAKAKKLTPHMALAAKIEQITPGEVLRFKIPEIWGGSFITVELNPQELQTGKKYILGMENAVHGMPGQKRTIMYVSDKPMEIAASIIDRNGELFITAGEKPVSPEKVAVGAAKEVASSGRTNNLV